MEETQWGATCILLEKIYNRLDLCSETVNSEILRVWQWYNSQFIDFEKAST